MVYTPFKELSLATLGMGTMRLPKTGSGEEIDEPKARELIDYAYNQGVNYFDTAYRYHDGALDIPKLISLYNEAKDADNVTWTHIGFTTDALKEAELPSACIACGTCAKLCPQGIAIPDVMKKFVELFANQCQQGKKR
jgi:predicted aldo/keto reductase-like oxidoreductase